jgi:hypothetical protein
MPLDNQSLAPQAKQIDVLVVGAGFARCTRSWSIPFAD